MSDTKLKAKMRDKTGKGATRKYRADGWIPAEFYSSHQDNMHLLLNRRDFELILTHAHGLFSLEVEGKDKDFQCVIKELQTEPVMGNLLHADFQGVKLGEKITLTVPIHLEGEAPGVKAGGIMEFLIREVEVECLPRHIPDSLEIDVSQLEIGDTVRVKDLEHENVRILDDPEETILLIEHSKIVKELEAADAAAAAAEEEIEELEGEEAQEPEVITARKKDEEEEEEKEKEKEKE
jgi:large subunit ribosomal protein L25